MVIKVTKWALLVISETTKLFTGLFVLPNIRFINKIRTHASKLLISFITRSN